MEYNELYQKYQELLGKYKKLEIEYENCKNQLQLALRKQDEGNINEEEIVMLDHSNDSAPVFIRSSPQDKIDLFLSLFKGRADVHAKRWENKKGGHGYSPACSNEWVNRVCHKPKVKCINCANKDFIPLDSAAVNRHLRGNEVLGIYPMLPDDTCYFLAIDFDKDGWQNDVNVIREICTEKDIPIAVERSRSGNGCHVWFFFSEPISAAKARTFGTLLLTQGMNRRHEIKFSSYDRLFPNQDTIAKGGFGNLIALPLQKVARESENSEFIDEAFQSYKDQWQFLSSIRKIDEGELDLYILQLRRGNELGDLRKEDDEEAKPWDKKKVDSQLSKNDIPDTVTITKYDMLYIEKRGFSSKALNTIKRLAAFRNPEFYKKQAMRLSTYDIPRVIASSDETPEYLCIPRGCETDLIRLFEPLHTDFEWIDETFSGKPIKVSFNGELYDEQQKAIQPLLQHDNGVLSATPGFGKTVIAAKLIAERKVNTLVIVPKRFLLHQWKERLNDFLTIDEELPPEPVKKRGRKKARNIIGEFYGEKKELNGFIDIAVNDSLLEKDEVRDLVREYGMVIIDECHYIPADNFERVLKKVTAKYVYGLTATPIRQDGHHPIIFMYCGPVRYKVDPKEQAEKRPFDHYIIPRFTPFRKPPSQDEKEWTIGEIYSQIGTSPIRNQMIISDVNQCVKEGRTPIVLTGRTAHVELLKTELSKTIPNVIELTGSLTAKQRRIHLETLSSIPQGDNFVIVATGKLVGEGFDEPRLDTLFLAMPVAWKGTVQQYAGRLHRTYQGKSEVQIYDYVDIHIGVLNRMYHKRLRGYASIGYTVKSDSKPFEKTNAIFDNKTFLSVFAKDISSSESDILIVSPYMTKKHLSEMLKILSSGINNGSKLTVVTRPAEEYEKTSQSYFIDMVNSIRLTGANLVFKPNLHQTFAIIDQRIVWYGSINLLSYGRSEESIIRLDSLDIANELIGSVEEMI